MSKDKYTKLRELTLVDYAEEVFLPPEEYAMVMSEFNTHMSEEDRRHRIVSKAIGNYWYTIVNIDFDDYIVIRKTPIEDNSILNKWKDKD